MKGCISLTLRYVLIESQGAAPDDNLDSPRTATATGTESTILTPEGLGEEKKQLLDEDKTPETGETNNPEVSAGVRGFEVIDVDEEIHLLD